MEYFTYTTLVQTEDGKIYDLGKRDFPPTHYHPGLRPCPGCFVVNAWTEKIGYWKVSNNGQTSHRG